MQRHTYYWISLGLLLSLILTIAACSTANKINRKIVQASQALEEKVNACTNNQERLYTLLQGDYIVHGIPPWDSVITLWRSKTDGDSIMLCIQAIGEPAKDGYLLLNGTFLTQSPNAPLSSYIISIEQVSRDTLVFWKYYYKDYTLREMLERQIEEDLNLKTFIDTSYRQPYGVYVKENNTKFNFTVSRRKYAYSGNDPSKQLRKMSGYIGLDMNETKTTYYTKEGTFSRDVYNYYIRRYNLDLRAWCTMDKKNKE